MTHLSLPTDNGIPESLYWSDEGLLKAAQACTCLKKLQQLYNENKTRIKSNAALRQVFAGCNPLTRVIARRRHYDDVAIQSRN